MYHADAFNCPYCQAYAHQSWWSLTRRNGSSAGASQSQCGRCHESALWFDANETLLWPQATGGVPAHTEMPEASRVLYDEARAVARLSPRAALALLRVAVDVLLREVVPGAGSKRLNDIVGLAVKQGLTPAARVALDALRVIGNDAVHPEQIVLDEEDPAAKVTALCRLLNLVVEQLVAQPRMASEMLDALPDGVKRGIEQRDGSLPDFGGSTAT